jgi:serine protease Do
VKRKYFHPNTYLVYEEIYTMKRWLLPTLMLLLGLGVGSTFVGSWLHGQNPQPIRPSAIPRELTSFRDVVKPILPAVVSIETRAKPVNGFKEMPLPFKDFPIPNDPSRFGFGSGFFIDPSGVVVTNYHVVEGAETAIVHLLDGRKFSSKNIRVDRRTDLAVILLDVKNGQFPFLAFGDSDAMEIGDRVLAVGAPFGLAGSVTQGIISAKGRNGLHMNMYEDFLQTDAAINPGNSGGPLVNLEGKVVGINAAIKSKNGGFQGVGLAVASNLAKNVVESLRTTGTVQRGYLGVQVRELDPQVAARLGVPKDTGVVIAQVFDSTPGSKGGLQAGDILTSVAGTAIKDGKMLQSVVARLPVNKVAVATVHRDGKTLDLNITVEEQPATYGTDATIPVPRNQSPLPNVVTLDALGIDIAELNGPIVEDFGYRKGTQGVIITRIHENSIATDSGLRRGMLITKIDNQAVNSPAAAQQVLQGTNLTRGILLQVASPQGGVSYVLLQK